VKTWIGFVASRYVSRGRKNSPSALFSVLGIAVGVLALTVIIAVMNGFQMGFIENILEISSGHIRIESFPEGEAGAGLLDAVRGAPGIVSAMPFRETSVLIRGNFSGVRGAAVRGVPPDILENDRGLAEKLVIESGAFDLSLPG